VSGLRVPEGSSQQLDVFGEQAQPAIGKIHGEKIAAAGDEVAPVIRHCRSSQPSDGFASLNPSMWRNPSAG
jgi:hypothetical protein